MNITVSVQTRRDAITAAEALGCEGRAAELVADRGGAALDRHAARVNAATAVALWWSADVCGEIGPAVDRENIVINGGDPWDYDESREAKALAWALLASDAYGAGTPGTWGASGRSKPLLCLGKGRRQATDGPAWSAAIASAADHINPGGWLFAAAGGRLVVRDLGGRDDVPCDALPPESAEAVCGQELLAAIDRNDRAAVAGWSAAYNEARERLMRDGWSVAEPATDEVGIEF